MKVAASMFLFQFPVHNPVPMHVLLPSPLIQLPIKTLLCLQDFELICTFVFVQITKLTTAQKSLAKMDKSGLKS